MKSIFLFFYFLLFFSLYLSGQKTKVDFEIPELYGFEHLERNEIKNDSNLRFFFKKLSQQKLKNNQVISIVHIGDSHLQADFLTQKVRESFQNNFGNAGRGLVLPYKLANTNEPHTYQVRSDGLWVSNRCTQTQRDFPLGIGGMVISTSDECSISISVDENNRFNKISLYGLLDDSHFDLWVEGGRVTKEFSKFFIELNEPTNFVNLSLVRKQANQTHATFFGFMVENTYNTGVLYHSLGINGAKYSSFGRAEKFVEQITDLQPDIIIISLGTNEAQDYKLTEEAFYQQIDDLVAPLREANPLAALLLTTPPDSYFRRKQLNYYLKEKAETIIRYAKDNHLAYWNLYQNTGGLGSCFLWKKNGLLRPDGVHYSIKGYQLQGNLLFHALMKNYMKYLLK